MNFETITEETFEEILKKENTDFDSLAKLLIKKLEAKGMKVATAESCTGGLISKLLTDEAGVSEVFDCGVCSYANCIKEKVLGVSADDLKNFGAVSPQVAAQMAEGVRALAGADMGISTTGIAGPTGGSVEKPVGTVFIGISTGDKTRVVKGDFSAKFNNRDKNRQLSSCLAIYCGFSSI
ncbi:MAG: nicotinamide-nucleotide amidohydrolase family protein [Ruminococcus sp.]|nr:nicotinamide-nucleotide amidohydrolase family protein [Ruminococcus sp.]